MPGNMTPFTVDELSSLLVEKFSGTKKDIENIGKMEEAVYNSKDPDLEGCESEEVFLQTEIIASAAAPLKKYYKNPSKENLTAIKSKLWGMELDPEFSPLAINYIKKILDKPVRNKSEEETFEMLTLQERILGTPDSVFEEALQKNAQAFGCFKQAPSEEMRCETGAMWYYKTIKLEGDFNTFLKDITGIFEKSVDDRAKDITIYACGGLALSGLCDSTAALGRDITELNHLKTKGLENYTGLGPGHPMCCYSTAKENDANLLRFFLLVSDNYYPSENPEKHLHKHFNWWLKLASDAGLTTTQIDEKIKPVRCTDSISELRLNLISKLDFAEKHIDFPWAERTK